MQLWRTKFAETTSKFNTKASQVYECLRASHWICLELICGMPPFLMVRFTLHCLEQIKQLKPLMRLPEQSLRKILLKPGLENSAVFCHNPVPGSKSLRKSQLTTTSLKNSAIFYRISKMSVQNENPKFIPRIATLSVLAALFFKLASFLSKLSH